MAKLPDAQSIALDPASPARPLAEYRGGQEQAGAAALGEAAAGFGRAVSQAGDQLYQAQERINYAHADQSFLAAKLSADQAALDDPDYATAPDRYKATIAEAAGKASTSINSPAMRAEFMASTMRLANYGADAVIRQSKAKAVQADRDWLNNYVSSSVDGALQAGDEPTSARFLTSAHDLIDAMTEKGSITAAEAQTQRKAVAETYAKRKAGMAIDLDPEAAARLLAPPGAENTPGMLGKRGPAAVTIPTTSRLAFVNNNPGNLEFAGQEGATKGEGGYARFETPAAGFDALQQQIGLDAKRGYDLSGFITKYAPPNANDTAGYVSDAVKALGVQPDTPISSIPAGRLARFMATRESSTTVSLADIQGEDRGVQPVAASGETLTAQPAVATSGADRVMFPKTGTWVDHLDPADRLDLARKARQQADVMAAARDANQQRAIVAQEKAQKDAAEKAGNGFVQQILTDPTKVDPTAIAKDPSLDWRQKVAITDVLRAKLKGEDKDGTKFGAGFDAAYADVHAADSDPRKITDPFQLYQRQVRTDPATGKTVGDLTTEGIDKLVGALKEPKDEGILKSAAMAYAKHQLSFEADYGTFKIPDPKGADAYNVGFLPAFESAYETARKGDGKTPGKTPSQLLSRDSPDFIVDKLIAGYKRSDEERAQDYQNASNGVAGAPAAKVDLATQPGIVAAYRAGTITREAAAAALVKGGFASAAAPPPAAAPASPAPPLH